MVTIMRVLILVTAKLEKLVATAAEKAWKGSLIVQMKQAGDNCNSQT